jgi:hypothetical protein
MFQMGVERWVSTLHHKILENFKKLDVGIELSGPATTMLLSYEIFPPRQSGFASGQQVVFVVDKAALGQVFP